MPAFATGLESDKEIPFAFGGADFPLNFEWTVENDDIVEISSAFASVSPCPVYEYE